MSEPTRLRLMWLLERLGAATVQQLCDQMPSTHQNVSRHLAVLWQAGFVSRARDGKTVRYALVDWTALWVVEQIASSVSAQLEAQQEHFQT